MRAQILIRADNDIKRRLEQAAKIRSQTLAGLLKQIIWDWLEANEAEKPPPKAIAGHPKG